MIEKLPGPATLFGDPVGKIEGVTFEECYEKCLQNEQCRSLVYGEKKKNCLFKSQNHTASSAIKYKSSAWFSAYKVCGKGSNCIGLLDLDNLLNIGSCWLGLLLLIR